MAIDPNIAHPFDTEQDDAAEWFSWVPIIGSSFTIEWADDTAAPIPYALICGCKGQSWWGGKRHTAACPLAAAHS